MSLRPRTLPGTDAWAYDREMRVGASSQSWPRSRALGLALLGALAAGCAGSVARGGTRSSSETVTLASEEHAAAASLPPRELELAGAAPGTAAGDAEASSAAGAPSPALEAAAPLAPTVPTPSPLFASVRPDLGGGYVVTGTTAHRLVLFTFDDGPHPIHTPRVLDELDRAGVRAVFFVVARRLARTTGAFAEVDDVLREIARRGHVVGSHTRDHEILTRLSPGEMEAQIVEAEELIASAIGARPWLFRPPGGMHDADIDAFLAARGYSEFLWSVAAEDWLTTDPDVVFRNFRRVMENRERRGTPGGVIVLHDTHPWTVAALPRIFGWIDARNCELLAAGEELYDIVEDPSLFVVRRPEGTSPSDPSPPIVLAPDVLAARQARARTRAAERCTAH